MGLFKDEELASMQAALGTARGKGIVKDYIAGFKEGIKDAKRGPFTVTLTLSMDRLSKVRTKNDAKSYGCGLAGLVYLLVGKDKNGKSLFYSVIEYEEQREKLISLVGEAQAAGKIVFVDDSVLRDKLTAILQSVLRRRYEKMKKYLADGGDPKHKAALDEFVGRINGFF